MGNKKKKMVEEKNGNKYLNIANASRNNEIFKKYNQVFDRIKYRVKKINDGDGKYDKDYMKVKFNNDDNIRLNKELYFPTITVIIRCAFYLDECLYQV